MNVRIESAPLRIGLLGAARIAEFAITEASRETGDIRASVAARNPERARAYAQQHEYEAVAESYEALIADDSLDVIYIGLPNGLHAEWTVRALAAGRSVLVEKPFAANLAEFDFVAAQMAKAQGWAWEAFHYADHPAIWRLLETIHSGEIGEVREIEVRLDMPAPAPNDPRWDFALAGGAMMDLGCYAIHVLILIAEALGAPLELRTAEADLAAADPLVDATVRATFDLGGANAILHTSMVSDGLDFSLRVIGSHGEATLPDFVKPFGDDRLLVRGVEGERVERTGTVSSYVYQLERVRAAVRGGERTAEELARSRRTIELIDAVYAACGLPPRPGRLERSEPLE